MEMSRWRALTDPEDQRDLYGESLTDAELSGAYDDPNPDDRDRDNEPGPYTRHADVFENDIF